MYVYVCSATTATTTGAAIITVTATGRATNKLSQSRKSKQTLRTREMAAPAHIAVYTGRK